MTYSNSKATTMADYKRILNEKYMPVEIDGVTFLARTEDGKFEYVQESKVRTFASLYTPDCMKPGMAFSLWKKTLADRLCRQVRFEPFTNEEQEESFILEGRVVRKHELDHGFRVCNVLDHSFSPDGGGQPRLVRCLNTFDGFRAKTQDGSCDLFKAHLFQVICRGNVEAYKKLLGFFAHIIREPRVRVPLIPVLFGEQGCGKTATLDYIREAIMPERYFSTLRPKDLSGTFNAALEDKLLVFADEATFSGDFNVINELKRLTGDKLIQIERKHMDARSTKNYARFVIATNRGWAAPVEEENRRYMLYPCKSPFPFGSDEYKAYFRALEAEKNNGGAAALNRLLMRVDLKDFDPYSCEDFFPEETKRVKFMTLLKTNPVEAYLMECEDEQVSDNANLFKSDSLNKQALKPALAHAMFQCWYESQSFQRTQQMPSRAEFESVMLKHGWEVRRVSSYRGTEKVFCRVGEPTLSPAPETKKKSREFPGGFQFTGQKKVPELN